MTEGTSEQSSSAALKPSDFVHLHNHTFHSVLDGLTKIHDLVDKVKELGMEAAAVTDHGTMSGILDYYKTAKKAGIKPIIGIETYVATRSRFDRDPGKDKQRFHLTVLAMNNTGFHNLMKLSTRANLEGMYYKPRIDHELLEELNEGLIVLSGCASGEIGVALKEDDYDRARDIAKWYKSIFGDRYYLELQDHGHPKSNTHWDVQAKINEGLIKLSKELDIEMVVTCDGHYLTHEYQDAHEILLCVGTGSYLSDEKRMSLKDFELHLTDPRDIIDHWGEEFPEVIRNTKKIADRCDVEIELGRILIPKYPLPDGENEHSYLLRLTYQGLLQRYNGASKEEAEKLDPDEIIPKLSDEVRERAEMELGVMGNMGYELDLTSLSDEEKAEIANQVNLYKELRPVVQLGQQYRLINPDAESNEAAVQFNYGNQTIVTYVRVLSVVETMETTLKLKDLEVEGLYELEGTNIVYSGAELMYAGLTVTLSPGDFLSRQYKFKRL